VDLNLRKEQFSAAYVRAVAALAGYAVSRPDPDEDSVDLSISVGGKSGLLRRPRLELQLKCTAEDIRRETEIRFPLPIKNYEDLRPEDLIVPRILVVVLVPRSIRDWVQQDEEALVMRHCGYWCSLRGYPPRTNARSVSVSLLRSKAFTVESLKMIMERVNERERP
jgi:hypothetical protein